MYLILVIKVIGQPAQHDCGVNAVWFLQGTKESADFGQGTALYGPQVPYL